MVMVAEPDRRGLWAGLAEEIEREDEAEGFEPEDAVLLLTAGPSERCELCGFLRCSCVSGLLAFRPQGAVRVVAAGPRASRECSTCQGHGGRTRSEYQGAVRRVWWEPCEDCRGTGVR